MICDPDAVSPAMAAAGVAAEAEAEAGAAAAAERVGAIYRAMRRAEAQDFAAWMLRRIRLRCGDQPMTVTKLR